MKRGRSHAAAVLLNKGSLFVSGGSFSTSYNTSEFPFEGEYGPSLPYEAYNSICVCQTNQTHLFLAGGEIAAETLLVSWNLSKNSHTRLSAQVCCLQFWVRTHAISSGSRDSGACAGCS